MQYDQRRVRESEMRLYKSFLTIVLLTVHPRTYTVILALHLYSSEKETNESRPVLMYCD